MAHFSSDHDVTYHDFETAAESAAQRLTRVAAANAAVVTAIAETL